MQATLSGLFTPQLNSFVHTAFAHSDEGAFFSKPVLVRQELVPGVPRFSLLGGVRRNIDDVESASKQLDLGLRLMIPVTTLPRPWIAWSRLLGRHDDAPPFSVFQSLVY